MTAQFNKALTTMSLQELTEHTAGYNPGHNIHTQGMVEFTRRQTDWQMKTAEAQIKAAEVEEKAANAAITRPSAQSLTVQKTKAEVRHSITLQHDCRRQIAAARQGQQWSGCADRSRSARDRGGAVFPA